VPAKRHKKGVQQTGLILTPDILWWVTLTDAHPVAVWARLKDIEVSDYRDSADFRMIPDSGVNLFGFIRSGPERGLAFIGLGEGPPADKLKVMLVEAVGKAGGISRL
jgi:hypothetical protein